MIDELGGLQRETKKRLNHELFTSPGTSLPFPLSPTTRPPIRLIARPPIPQLSSRFDSRATRARTLLTAAMASVPFGFELA
jgi:hypothetical protein